MVATIWILIGVLVLLIIIFAKAKEIRHRIFVLIFILVLIFLIFTGINLYSNEGVDFKSLDGWMYAGKFYFSWLKQIFGNIVELTGQAIGKDWSLDLSNATGAGK